MFFSADLLSVRGGKFGTIWLLATTKDRQAIVKKRKAELLRTNMAQLCQDLVKMFPVQGKKKSFSLRTSSILMYGTCINLRVMSEDLLRSVLALLGHRAAGKGPKSGSGIDLPGGQMATNLERLEMPTLADLDMGNMMMIDLNEVYDKVDFRARPSDITMMEPDMGRLEYEGQELPILTTRDILTESWSLDDTAPAGEQVAVQDEVEPNRKSPPDRELLPATKRARLDDPPEHEVGELAPEVTVVGQDGESEQAAGAPLRPRVPSVPTIEVTPAMEEEKTRKRTPTMLDMEAAAAVDDTMPLPHSPPPAADDLPPPDFPSPPAPPASAPQLDLQPLVPAPARQPRPGKKGRGLVWVDVHTQISADCIRRGLNNYKDTMRVQEVSKDMARQLPEVVRFTAAGRRLGVALGEDYKEVVRVVGVARAPSTWDWGKEVEEVDEEVVAEEREREGTVGEGSIEVSGQGSRLEDGSRRGSFLGVPQAESSRIVLADVIEEGGVAGMAGGQDGGEVVGGYDGRGSLAPGEEVHLDLSPTVQEGNQQEVDMVIAQQDPFANDLQNMEIDEDPGQQPINSTAFSPLPVSPSPTISQDTVQAKLTQLADGNGFCLFSTLCPPTSTRRGEAAVTFLLLLQMEKEGKVTTKQEEDFGDIKIYPSED